jgi:UPF0755 protein
LQEESYLKIWKIAASVAAIAVCAALGIGWYAADQLKPTTAGQDPVLVEIPEGTPSRGIADILEEEGIIRNGSIFAYYLKYKGLGRNFQAGTYEMKPGMEISEIITALAEGKTVKEEVVRFTIPEGYTAGKIIDMLSLEYGFSREELTTLLNSRKAIDDAAEDDRPVWAATAPSDREVKFLLEGYLFPETYELPKKATAEQAVRRMLRELDHKLTQLPQGWEARLAELNISFHELLTIASLIEREVRIDEERSLVAGVIYNRLRKDMPLQLDATIQYLFEEQKERIYEKDLKIESPYNTYLNSGLPPGPIASPGLKSIEAALHPETTKYLFYVTRKDGTGGHLFAETYEQHLKNIKKSKQAG